MDRRNLPNAEEVIEKTVSYILFLCLIDILICFYEYAFIFVLQRNKAVENPDKRKNDADEALSEVLKIESSIKILGEYLLGVWELTTLAGPQLPQM